MTVTGRGYEGSSKSPISYFRKHSAPKLLGLGPGKAARLVRATRRCTSSKNFSRNVTCDRSRGFRTLERAYRNMARIRTTNIIEGSGLAGRGAEPQAR